jgi:cephalosporin-C deacetylase-like acetyl esterase
LKKYYFLLLLCSLFFANELLYAQSKPVQRNVNASLAPEEENLNVFQDWIHWNNPGSLLINHLIKQAFIYYDIRDSAIARLKSESDWRKRQENVRDKLMEFIGPFPKKTALNPRITGVLKKEGYRIEKIIYESLPGFYVTGCLYIPDRIKGKVPAILNVIGHNQESFRNQLYQVINFNLVKKGIIVFAIDPPGQGEHVQYYDTAVKFSSIGYSVIEHCYFGNQCFLSGSSCAKYFIWDGMRAIDYLLTRKEVDPGRIGVTVFSGGGTVTSYIGALDDRVKVSVPCSWATVSRRQLETKGGQDAETGFYRGVAEGITFEDLLEVRAPRPTLLTFVSRDEYLCLQGAREAYNEAKNAYEILGHADNLKMVEDDSKHWMTPKIRLAIYEFFMKHFNISGDPEEQEAEILSEKELTVTPTGQISTFLGGEMIFDVNKKETEKLIENLEKSRQNIENHLKTVQIKAKEISGFVSPPSSAVNPFINGRYKREGYSVGKYAIRGEGDYVIPILLFVPNDNVEKHPALIYIHPMGKAAEAKPGGEIEKLVKEGYIVAAIDVLGTGETKNTAARELADSYTAIIIGRSIVGIQAGDIVRAADYLKSLSGVDSAKIGAIGINEMCIPLMHAAAFDRSISNVVLISSPVSYRSIAMNRYYKNGLSIHKGGGFWHHYEVDFSWGVAGALTAYDLPDLIGCIAPRRVVLAGLKDQMLEPASAELIDQELKFPRSVYSIIKASENLKVIPSFDSLGSLVEWSFK